MDKTIVKPRYYSLDALRALAMLMGIYMHSTHSFFMDMWTGVQDASATMISSIILVPSFFIPSLFRMQTFFLVAGFFGRMLFHRDGLKGMVINRAKRVGIPFLFGLTVLIPLVHIIRLYGRARKADPEATFPFSEVIPFLTASFSSSSNEMHFNLPHYMWFLYFLLLIYALTLILRSIFVRIDSNKKWAAWLDQKIDKITASKWGPVKMMLPMILIMALIQGPFFSEIGISLIPQPGILLMYSMFFWMGWMIHRQTSILENLSKNCWANARNGGIVLLTILLIVGVGFLLFTPQQSETSTSQDTTENVSQITTPVETDSQPNPQTEDQPEFNEGEMPDFSQLPLGAKIGLYVFRVAVTYFMWTFCFALVGIFVRYLDKPNPTLRYIADSSYWLYLAHVPLLMWMQIEVAYWNWHWLPKIVFLNVVNTVILLILYHYCVRSTFIGAILNGKKYPRKFPWTT